MSLTGDKKKVLLILRHAKSSLKYGDIPDHDRPLNKRGKKQAPEMGILLKQLQLVPDYVISSTAKRAVDTAKSVAEFCGYGGEINHDSLLTRPRQNSMPKFSVSFPMIIPKSLLWGTTPQLKIWLKN